MRCGWIFLSFFLKAKHLKNQTSYSIRSSMEEIVQKLQLSKKLLMRSNLNLKIFSKRSLHHHLWSVLIWLQMEVSYFSGLPERRCCSLQSRHNFDGQVLSIFFSENYGCCHVCSSRKLRRERNLYKGAWQWIERRGKGVGLHGEEDRVLSSDLWRANVQSIPLLLICRPDLKNNVYNIYFKTESLWYSKWKLSTAFKYINICK